MFNALKTTETETKTEKFGISIMFRTFKDMNAKMLVSDPQDHKSKKKKKKIKIKIKIKDDK